MKDGKNNCYFAYGDIQNSFIKLKSRNVQTRAAYTRNINLPIPRTEIFKKKHPITKGH